MTIYKLTDQHLRTYGGFQYTLGVEATATGEGGLCSPGLLHFYLSPEVAALLNPIHAAIQTPRLWRAETSDVPVMDGTRKGGVRRMTLIEELPLPVLTTEQRVQVAIVCAWPTGSSGWRRWALGWLRGEDRAAAKAAAAAGAAWAAEAAEAAWEAEAADIPAILTQTLSETSAQTADRLERGA